MKNLQEVAFKVAKHEIGHWLGWRLYGGKSKGIEIKIYSENGRHTGAFEPDLEIPITEHHLAVEYVKARLITLYAGIYAESFIGPDYDSQNIINNFSHLGGASSDYHKAIELMRLYCNLLGLPHKYKEISDEIDQEAAHMIATNFCFISDAARRVSEMALYEGQDIMVSDEKLSKWLTEYHR